MLARMRSVKCYQGLSLSLEVPEKHTEIEETWLFCWLDLANAYGSIPDKLVETSLVQHHVPGKIMNLILGCYKCLSLRVTSGTTSIQHQLEV